MSIENKRPNIVFIITDQQRFDTIHALGFEHAITPHLDRLVTGGTTFTRTYVTAPSCAPSRASLFMGLYPHSSGVLRNDEPWRHSWVEQLAESGYRCVNVGKMHAYPYETSLGFHERHVVENKDRDHPSLPFFLDQWDKALWARGIDKPSRVSYRLREDYRDRLGAFVWDAPADMHPDNFVAGLAGLWLERYRTDEPFFLQIGFPGPHPPYDPTPEYLDKFAERDVPMPVCPEGDINQQPAPLKALRQGHLHEDHDAIVHLESPTSAQLIRQRRHYHANVTMIDAQVGQLMSALKERGVLDNTVIVFTSDHGDCLNDHGHSQKWTMYEPSVHVPAIVWGKGVRADQRIDGLTSLMDLGPTVLELAGCQPPEWMEARSLLPALQGERWSGREHVFSEHARDFILADTELMTMVRDDRWKLVMFIDCEEGQLFDLHADPDEINNLWAKGDLAPIREHLEQVIARWRAESAMRTSAWPARFR